jgi:4-alpha-glucanotransferase
MVELSVASTGRSAGLLLHLAALGGGALGRPAHEFVDWLAEAGFRYWQMLPLGPVGTDGSPYWVLSDAAGNTTWLPDSAPVSERSLEFFVADNAAWLTDFSLHQALAARHGPVWTDWPVALRDRHPQAIELATRLLAGELRDIARAQAAFDGHWQALRAYARRRGIGLIGDLPMYVAPGSVETWVHRQEFKLDADGRPTLLAGVPPDYFSADGQLWGNPVYDWSHAAANGFAHFRRRIRAAMRRFDLLRIDHFRALSAHWVVAPGAGDAREGHWRKTPGADALAALRTEWPEMPFIAEDLGDITHEVLALRDQFALPGMQVLQFAFDGDPHNLHLPENGREHSVAYLGTHDNDTTLGWVLGLDSEMLRRVAARYQLRPGLVPSAMRRELLASRAALAVLTMPDLLALGSEARYNTPGTAAGNWRWQLPQGSTTRSLAAQCRGELVAAGRVGVQREPV